MNCALAMTSPASEVRPRSFSALTRWLVISAMLLVSAGSVLAQPEKGPLLPPEVTASRELGRLMLTPADRKTLEALRQSMRDPEQRARAASLDLLGLGESEQTAPDTLSVRGVVTRSGDRSTVWINGQPLYGRAAASALRDLATQSGVLQSGVKDVRLKFKPGQVVDVPSGQAVDLLPPGAIKIIPPKTRR